MSARCFPLVAITVLALALFAVSAPASAQDGTLKVKVKPKSGYTLVDGRPMGQGSHTITLPAGEHEVGVYRYGRKPHVETVTIDAGQTTNLNVTLESVPGTVSGPWSRLRLLVKPNQAAVFLNGRTPDFLIGCAGSTDGHFLIGQELLVPPGTHTIALALDGYVTYTTEVTVEANQRAEIRHTMQRGSGEEPLSPGTLSFKPENKLAAVGDRPRDQGDGNSMKAAVASLSAQLSADPAQISCGDSSRLTWSSTEAARGEISGVGGVAASGEQLVTPAATTTYDFTAAGPGGVQTASATVNVDASIQASLSVNPPEIRYRKIGDKVIEHGTTEIIWSTSKADTVSIDPLGSVSAAGSRSLQPAPARTETGAVDESVTYTLNASNPCGTAETRAASLRITGSIEPLPEVVLASVFFPTDYPDARNPDLGLLRSQQQTLSSLADGFKKYLDYDPDARLVLESHADQRHSRPYNQALSERRAARVKQFLVDQGIAGASIETTGFGEDQNLERSTVEALEQQNPNQPPPRRLRARFTDWLAHNRRVDIVLRPAGETSTRYYPHHAADSGILWQQPKPSPRVVEGSQ